jgi:hypothetical protein
MRVQRTQVFVVKRADGVEMGGHAVGEQLESA